MYNDKSMKLSRWTVIYVLDDGETYSGAPAVPLAVNKEELERIEAGEKIYNVIPEWKRRGE